MKIGILTFQNTLNYGALLQNYALQKQIKKYNEDCETIDYICSDVEKRESVKELKDLRSFKDYIKYILFGRKLVRKKNKFNDFIDKNIVLSNKKYYRNDVNEIARIYDNIIVGSDQIWNYNLTNFDYTYLLDFVNDETKKNSYAASLGISEIADTEQIKYKTYLQKFDNISVREQKGKEIIDNLIKNNVDVVLDPTLLMKKEEWIEELNINKLKNKKEYIVYYTMQEEENLLEFAKKLAKKSKCQLINLNPNIRNIYKMKSIIDLDPKEWIEMLYNSKYIVTNSFHGLAFSIILNKDFFIEIPNNNNKTSSRLKNLLELLNLEDRIIKNKECGTNNVNWNEVNEKLESEREKSIKFLEKIIKQ